MKHYKIKANSATRKIIAVVLLICVTALTPVQVLYSQAIKYESSTNTENAGTRRVPRYVERVSYNK